MHGVVPTGRAINIMASDLEDDEGELGKPHSGPHRVPVLVELQNRLVIVRLLYRALVTEPAAAAVTIARFTVTSGASSGRFSCTE